MALAASACGKKEKELSPARIRAVADSIVESRMDKLRRQAKEDLDRRLPIEVKPKVDSILKVNHNIDQIPVFPVDDDPPETEPVHSIAHPAKDTAKK